MDYAGDNKGRFVQWDIVLACMWVVKRESRRDFEGIEHEFIHE